MRTALLTLLLPLAACSSTPTTHFSHAKPLSSFETIELDYKGAYSNKGLPDAEHAPYPGELATVDKVGVQVRIYEVQPAAIPGLLHAKGVWLRADRVNRKEALGVMEELLASDSAALFNNSRLLLGRGSRSNISVCNTFSFVESFDMKPVGVVSLGDPNVSTGREGVQLEVAPALTDEEGLCTIDIKLSLATVLRPIQSTNRIVPGTNASMTIQTPVYSTQELSFNTTLGAAQSLMIGPLPPTSVDSNPLMLLVSADAVPLPGEFEPCEGERKEDGQEICPVSGQLVTE